MRVTATGASAAPHAGHDAAREFTQGLLWTLGVDACGTVAYALVAIWALASGHNDANYLSALALVAVVGLAAAAVAITMTASTVHHHNTSRSVLRASIGLVIVGLILNTGGAVVVLVSIPEGNPGLAALLLLAGDALSAIYIALIWKTIRVVGSPMSRAMRTVKPSSVPGAET